MPNFNFNLGENTQNNFVKVGDQVLTITKDLSDHKAFASQPTENLRLTYEVQDKEHRTGFLRLYPYCKDGTSNAFFNFFLRNTLEQNKQKVSQVSGSLNSSTLVGLKFVANVHTKTSKDGKNYNLVEPFCYKEITGVLQTATADEKKANRINVVTLQQKIWDDYHKATTQAAPFVEPQQN